MATALIEPYHCQIRETDGVFDVLDDAGQKLCQSHHPGESYAMAAAIQAILSAAKSGEAALTDDAIWETTREATARYAETAVAGGIFFETVEELLYEASVAAFRASHCCPQDSVRRRLASAVSTALNSVIEDDFETCSARFRDRFFDVVTAVNAAMDPGRRRSPPYCGAYFVPHEGSDVARESDAVVACKMGRNWEAQIVAATLNAAADAPTVSVGKTVLALVDGLLRAGDAMALGPDQMMRLLLRSAEVFSDEDKNSLLKRHAVTVFRNAIIDAKESFIQVVANILHVANVGRK